MTPEELNRAMEFIIEHQAKTSANLDQISEDFDRERKERGKCEKWANTILAELAANHRRMADLITLQSSRLDRAEAEDRAAQERHEVLIEGMRTDFKEMRVGFDRILERLPGKAN